MSARRVAVILGGRSGEHEVSIRSARSVMDALDRDLWEVVPIGISKRGHWLSAAETRRALDAGVHAFGEAGMPMLGATGALAALDDEEHLRRTRENNAIGLSFFTRELKALRLEFVPSAANFVLVEAGDGQRVFDRMQRQGVITRPMGGYGLPQWIRITIGTPEENRRCLAALKEALADDLKK